MNTTAATAFTVVTQHGIGREVRTAGFDSLDEAVAHAKANDPDTDGSLCPQVDEDIARTFGEYEKGIFWLSASNRYAVIVRSAR